MANKKSKCNGKTAEKVKSNLVEYLRKLAEQESLR